MKHPFVVYLGFLIALISILGFVAPGLVEKDADTGRSSPEIIQPGYGVDSEANNLGSEIGTRLGPELSGRYQMQGSVVSDDFNSCVLDDELWTFVNPLGDSTVSVTGTHTTDAWVSIAVPGGERHSISPSNTNAPRIMQSVADSDFEIEVKFESGVEDRYQIQGILVEDAANEKFIRFEFHGDGAGTVIYSGIFTGTTNTLTQVARDSITTTNVAPLYMRVKREGDVWTQSYSYNGGLWLPTDPVTFTHPLAVSEVGLFAGNSKLSGDPAIPAHTASFDYFFNTASPIDPEDGDTQNTLTVDWVGMGVVDVDPSQTAYDCGDEVTLTATADTHWHFDSWSGDLVGSTNPATLTITGDNVVTATFTQDTYDLTINKVGSGTVDKEPNKPSYPYGDVVTLTATADPGWSFDSWSGDLSGNDNPDTITMTSDRVVTATFTQDTYSLAINKEGTGTGSVDVEPNLPGYLYGQVVTLTATADPDSRFDSWSGDLSGNDNPATLTISRDHVVTATFVMDEERVFLPLILKQK